MSDEFYIELLKQGNELAYKEFYYEYSMYFKKLALGNYGYMLQSIPLEDLIEDAFYISLIAIKDYDKQKDATFRTFVTLCVTRSWIRLYHNRMHYDSTPMLSLDSIVLCDRNDTSYYDVIPDSKALNPLDVLKAEEAADAIVETVSQSEIKYSKEIVMMLFQGYSIKEISKTLNITDKVVNNTLYRIRKMLKSKKSN